MINDVCLIGKLFFLIGVDAVLQMLYIGETRMQKICVLLFVSVWVALSKFYNKKQLFVLQWIMRDESVMHLFIANVTEFDPEKCS